MSASDPKRTSGYWLANLFVSVLERNHIAAGYSNPLDSHGWSTARHVPCSVGLAEGTFRKQAIHRIDHVVTALGGGRPGAKTDSLGRGAADYNRLDAVVFQSLVKIVAKEFVGSARSLIDNLALMRRDAFINDFAAARQRIRDEHAGGECSIMQRLNRRNRSDAARTLAAIFGHEVEQQKCRAFGVDRHRLQRGSAATEWSTIQR